MSLDSPNIEFPIDVKQKPFEGFRNQSFSIDIEKNSDIESAKNNNEKVTEHKILELKSNLPILSIYNLLNR